MKTSTISISRHIRSDLDFWFAFLLFSNFLVLKSQVSTLIFLIVIYFTFRRGQQRVPDRRGVRRVAFGGTGYGPRGRRAWSLPIAPAGLVAWSMNSADMLLVYYIFCQTHFLFWHFTEIIGDFLQKIIKERWIFS